MIDRYGGCWVQLYLFSSEFRERIGTKFIYSDLDVAILGDMGEIYDRSKHLTITEGRLAPLFAAVEKASGGKAPRTLSWEIFFKLARENSVALAIRYSKIAKQRWCRFNGSFMIIDKDQPDDMWAGLDPSAAAKQTLAAHLLGSNQAWLQLREQGDIATVGKADGFWFKRDIQDYYAFHRKLPPGLRMIVFAGAKSNPWNPLIQKQTWVRQAYNPA